MARTGFDHRHSGARTLAVWHVLVALMAVGVAALVLAAFRQYRVHHQGPALDYVAFWAAGRLAMQGHAALAYDASAIGPAQRAAVDMGAPNYFPFYYPPPALLLFLPFSVLPYGLAFAAFVAAQWSLLTAALRRLLTPPWPISTILFAPAMLLNGGLGQNGGWTAGCMALGAGLLDRMPALAGVALGLLALKPHVAILVPVALAAAGRWRALTFAVATVFALAAASLIFGTQSWVRFIAVGAQARGTVEGFSDDWVKMITPFAACRLAGAGIGAAYAAQAVFALGSAGMVILCRRATGAWLVAVVAAATLLQSPYLFDYDLPLTLIPLSLVAAAGMAGGWRGLEKPVCVAVFLSPLVLRPGAMITGAGVAPLLDAALLAVVARRSLATPGQPA